MFAKVLLIAALSLVAWAIVARASEGAAPGRAYTVRAHDTLWSIAARQYGGDPRDGIWKIERRNRLGSALIRPGQRLVLP
jgi:nucleoid-associated protein YgaU